MKTTKSNFKKNIDSKEPIPITIISGFLGAGKTTLLKILIGLHELDKGNIIYDGRIFNKMKFYYEFDEEYANYKNILITQADLTDYKNIESI